MYEVAYFTGLRKAGMREKIIATRGLATRYGLSVSCGSLADSPGAAGNIKTTERSASPKGKDCLTPIRRF